MRRHWWTVLLMALAGGGSIFLLGANGCGVSSPLSIDQPTEIRIGQQAAVDLEHQYGLYTDPTAVARVQRIGSRIAAVSERPSLPWSFKILNTNDVNAVSLPGGPVYVTRGLMALNPSDAELAGVLGHEIAHIDKRHAVKQIQQAMTYQVLSDVILGNDQATRNAANIAIQYALELPHSRQDEYEADNIGIRLAYNAGYPANGLVAFLQELQRISGPSRTPEWMSTHPLTPERITRAEQVVAQVQGQPRPVPVALSESDQKVLKALVDEEMAQKP